MMSIIFIIILLSTASLVECDGKCNHHKLFGVYQKKVSFYPKSIVKDIVVTDKLIIRGGNIETDGVHREQEDFVMKRQRKASNTTPSPKKKSNCTKAKNNSHLKQNSLLLNEFKQQQQQDQTIVKAVLIPRQFSIPRLIRLFSCLLFTITLSECFRTSGQPYTKTIQALLSANGMLSSKSKFKLSSMDEYLAKKIIQANNGILPPKYLPSPLPLLGLYLSLFLSIGITILFPKWFLDFKVWLNYHRIDVLYDDKKVKESVSSKEVDHLQMISSLFVDEDGVGKSMKSLDENDSRFYQSQLMNHQLSGMRDGNIGLALLVHLSQQDREISNYGKPDVIRWVHHSEDEDQPHKHYIEQNQRRLYIDLSISPSSTLRTEGSKLKVDCHDGGPTFFKTQSLSTLLSRNSRSGLSNMKDLRHAQNRYAPYAITPLPIPTVNEAFSKRISNPLSVVQLISRILIALEEDFIPSCANILMTLGQHYYNAKKSIVTAQELSQEIGDNVEQTVEMKVWVLRPKMRSENKKKKSKKGWVVIHL